MQLKSSEMWICSFVTYEMWIIKCDISKMLWLQPPEGHIITPHYNWYLTVESIENLPTAGKGTNLCIIILVAGLSLLAFWISTFSPTC